MIAYTSSVEGCLMVSGMYVLRHFRFASTTGYGMIPRGKRRNIHVFGREEILGELDAQLASSIVCCGHLRHHV